jgi:hypothetical protein
LTCLVLLSFGLNLLGHTDPVSQLVGTWQVEGQAVYEHWDRLGETALKGFSYELKDGQPVVSEYLDLFKRGDDWVYAATVLNQNEGRTVEFVQCQGDKGAISFENPAHDFPRRIVYRFVSDREMAVTVSDGAGKGFTLKLLRR